MAKRVLFWHIGPVDPTTALLPAALEAAAATRATDFLTCTAREARDADIDLRRAHKAAGRGRKEVEGAWSRLESQIWHRKGTWLVSTPAATLADHDQFRLAMDGLKGVKVHFVYFGEATDEVLTTWTQPLHPQRVHVLPRPADLSSAWAALQEAAGVTPVPLPSGIDSVPTAEASAVLERTAQALESGRPDLIAATSRLLGDHTDGEDELAATTRALAAAITTVAARELEIERLRAEVERLDRKRRKHKQRVAHLEQVVEQEAAAPVTAA